LDDLDDACAERDMWIDRYKRLILSIRKKLPCVGIRAICEGEDEPNCLECTMQGAKAWQRRAEELERGMMMLFDVCKECVAYQDRVDAEPCASCALGKARVLFGEARFEGKEKKRDDD